MTMKIYTLGEIMELLKVTRRTLYNHINEGKLDAFKVGDRWRVTEESLKKYLTQNITKSEK
ncbi:helix-turn-helix domain-containing protein [Parasutterella secunda]|uniref:helix-turn-helix domain-containing protein n=1 Tax=Parasutterella secunda TaxID=626947 RepID=UPI003364D352